MNKLNLSTQPFLNERIINFFLGVLMVFLFSCFLSVFSQWRVLLEQEDRLQMKVLDDLQASDSLAAQTVGLLRESASVDFARTAEEMDDARELVERRAFSWSTFLANLESAIPPTVKLTTFTPEVSNNIISFSLGIRGQVANDLNLFLESLERGSGFSRLLIMEEELGQDGDYLGILEGLYRETDDDSGY